MSFNVVMKQFSFVFQEQHALFSEMSALSGDNVLQGHTTLAQLLLARENADLQAFKVHSLKLSGAPAKKCKC